MGPVGKFNTNNKKEETMRTVIKGIKRTSLRNLRDTQISPSLRIPQGVQALFLGLLTSFGLSAIISGAFFSDSAYAAYSASISRTSSGTITLSDGSGSSIKPSSTGTLGTGSDTVSVSSNCTAGYNLYVSAISGGSTNLSTDGGTDYIPSTTTATGSEATLSKDTWGVGKNGTTFSKLPAYSTDASTWTALYTGTGDASSTAKNYTVYYGANVSTAKTPGTYTGDVLYTVIMNSACEKYTLKFDDDGATTINLEDQQIAFDAEINLADISSTDKIAKTGYHLTGWKDQNNKEYGITGKADVNPNDLSVVTLTAQWTKNSYAVTVNKGTNVTTVTGEGTYNYGSAVSVAATAFKTGYHFSSWTVNSGGVTLYSNSAMTTQSTTTTPAYFSMPNNAVTVTANAAANTYTIKYAAGSTGGSCSVSDTAATYDQDVKLSDTVCTKSGAEQKGWAADPSGSPKSYDLGATLTKPNLTSTNGGSVTLYPYFENTTAYFQSTSCTSLTAGATTTLVDSRDNQKYSVYRFPTDVKYAGTSTVANVAGKCIMTKDLNLGAVASVSGASSTIVANGTMTLSPSDSGFTTPTGSGESITVPTSNVTVNMTWSSTDRYSNKHYHTNGTGDYAGRGYYSWGAAMVVCPKGWRLPTSDEYNNNGSWESSTTGISAVVKGANAAATISNITGSPYSFVLGGGYNDGWGNATSNGRYWSSTQYDSSLAYSLYMNSSNGLSRNSDYKRLGRSVRCMAE